MLPITEALPLAGFVFWLISFPMNGFLMPEQWGNYLFYFTFSSAVSYFLSPFFLKKEKVFDILSRLGTLLVVLLTLLSPLSQISGKVMLSLMGILSVFVMFRSIAVLRSSRDPLVSAALAIAIGNVLVFALSHLNLQDIFKFFIVAASLFPAIIISAEYSEDSNTGEIKKYLAFIFIFYLVGGILYAYIMPQYEKVTIFNGFELLSYVFSALVGIYFVKKRRDIALALGIILGTLSFSFMLLGGSFFTTLSMFSSQASFGLVDLYIVFLLVACGGTARITGFGFGTVCLAITCGEAVSSYIDGATAPVIATGNIILVTSVIIFYLTILREKGGFSVAEDVIGGNNSESLEKGIFKGELEEILERSYEPFQKRLSEKEKSVLLLVIQGKTYRDAATDLGISESTVKTHMKRICEKMGVYNKDDLMEKLLSNSRTDITAS